MPVDPRYRLTYFAGTSTESFELVDLVSKSSVVLLFSDLSPI